MPSKKSKNPEIPDNLLNKFMKDLGTNMVVVFALSGEKGVMVAVRGNTGIEGLITLSESMEATRMDIVQKGYAQLKELLNA